MTTRLRRWWSESWDYDWAVRYLLSRETLDFNRIMVGLSTCVFGLAGVLSIPTGISPRGSVLADAVVAAGSVTSFGVAVAWFRGPWPTRTMSLAFIAYSDLGVAVALFSFDKPFDSMPGGALLAVVGAYVTIFHGPRVLLIHLGFSGVVMVALYVLVLQQEGSDIWIATARLVTLVPIMLSVPVITQSLMVTLLEDAADSYRDPLTRLRNRRGLHAAVVDLMGRPAPDVPLAVLVVDIDNFKAINDNHGHIRGDEVLALAADRMAEICGDVAVVARIGGEEFAVVLRADSVEAGALASTLHDTLACPTDVYPITVSVGVAHSHDISAADSRTITGLIDRADSAMYQAKAKGGNGTYIAH